MLRILSRTAVVLVLALLSPGSESSVLRDETSAPRQSCGTCPSTVADPNVVNVHLVPHSHDDVGWLKTVDQYFYGAKDTIQIAGVQYIIDSVVRELSLDPSKRFIQVETAFFKRWWDEQSEETRDVVRALVNEGRMELTGGGWSMHDEAAPHYSAMIDNMAHGFRTLKEMFGDCGVPKIGWQIDPFGHSREQTSLFAQMGFDGLFFARIDYREKAQRKEQKTLQFVWDGTDHLGEATSLFTGVFEDHYSAPAGHCYDVKCYDDPIEDDPNLKDYNLEEKLESFVQHVETSKSFFINQNHIMYTMGDDFTYMNAQTYYKNLDKLIAHMNSRTAETGIHLLYSTPSCFLQALNDAGEAWPTMEHDFFPYGFAYKRNEDGEVYAPHSYWTGYYTSRPSFKLHERISNSRLQATKQIDALFEAGRQDDLAVLQNALAVSQHHDAITGTAKQPVDSDYNERLGEGEMAAQRLMAQEIFKNIGITLGDDRYFCPLLNISQCDITEQNQAVIVTVYNPLPRRNSYVIRLPLKSTSSAIIRDDQGSDVLSETIPISDKVAAIPGRESSADVEVIFKAEDVPPLGYKAFHLEKTSTNESTVLPARKISVEEFKRNLPADLDVALKYYLGHQNGEEQASGAYVFRPAVNDPTPTDIVGDVIEIGGQLVTEWRVTLSIDWASFAVRRYQGDEHYEIEWLVGPIPVDDDQGKEVIMTYSTSVDNEGVFWTDSNGRQMMRRVRNERPTYDIIDVEKEPVASNYYPVVAGIYLASSNDSHVSVLTDRTQGGSSINDSQIELMVHRRLLLDDGFGVGEALNETAFDQGLVAGGKHYYFAGNGAESARWRRQRAQENYLSPQIILVPTEIPFDEWNTSYPNKVFSGLSRDLPDNINILTLESWNEAGDILLRLEHLYGPDENPELSQPEDVDLSGLFTTLFPLTMTEMTLGGNVELASARRMHWTTDKYENTHPRQHDMLPEDENHQREVVRMEPMAIRTFLLNVATTETQSTTVSTSTEETSGAAFSSLAASSLMVLLMVLLAHIVTLC